MPGLANTGVPAAALLMAGNAAIGATLYEAVHDTTPTAQNSFTQQAGHDQAYYGDDVHLASPSRVNSITILFSLFTYSYQGSYTPDIRVDLFNVNSSGLPLDSNTSDTLAYTPIAGARNNSVTFAGSDYNNHGLASVYTTAQAVTFDFSSQSGAANLKDFAFAYRDVNPAGTTNPYFGFSVLVTSAAPRTGSTFANFLGASPNDLHTTNFYTVLPDPGDPSWAVEATITGVPEPSALGMLSIGGAVAMRRRAKMRSR